MRSASAKPNPFWRCLCIGFTYPCPWYIKIETKKKIQAKMSARPTIPVTCGGDGGVEGKRRKKIQINDRRMRKMHRRQMNACGNWEWNEEKTKYSYNEKLNHVEPYRNDFSMYREKKNAESGMEWEWGEWKEKNKTHLLFTIHFVHGTRTFDYSTTYNSVKVIKCNTIQESTK